MALLDEYEVGGDRPWSGREAAHLWRRAGFGATLAERTEAVGDGDQQSLRAAVDRLVNYEPLDPILDAAGGGPEWGGPIASLPNDDSNEGRTKNPSDIEWVRAHLFYRFAFTSQPFQEQFGLFLHDHMVSDFDKVLKEFEDFQEAFIDVRKACCDVLLDQYAIFREMGINNFRELMVAITRNPAMLLYLDNYTNGLGEGRAQENYAREVMELFSMGVNNYSEEDVREIARCFTGEALPQLRDPGAPDALHYGYRPGNHELGDKNVFGHIVHEDLTGQETLDVIDLILQKTCVRPDLSGYASPYNDLPATAVYMSWKLMRWFVSQNIELDPPHPAVLELADYLRGSDGQSYPQRRFPYDMRAAMRKLFLSKFFYDQENYFAITKTPADYVASSIHLMDIDFVRSSGGGPAAKMASMGMALYGAPNVSGWAHGRSWINASYMVERYNFADDIQRLITDAHIDALQVANGGPIDPDDDATIIEYLRDLVIQDDVEFNAPGATELFHEFLVGVAESTGNVESRFREKVRGLFYLMITMPIGQMK